MINTLLIAGGFIQGRTECRAPGALPPGAIIRGRKIRIEKLFLSKQDLLEVNTVGAGIPNTFSFQDCVVYFDQQMRAMLTIPAINHLFQHFNIFFRHEWKWKTKSTLKSRKIREKGVFICVKPSFLLFWQSKLYKTLKRIILTIKWVGWSKSLTGKALLFLCVPCEFLTRSWLHFGTTISYFGNCTFSSKQDQCFCRSSKGRVWSKFPKQLVIQAK